MYDQRLTEVLDHSFIHKVLATVFPGHSPGLVGITTAVSSCK